VDEFEAAFAAELDVPHAVGVANGTDALELALRAAGVGRGDEVLVPANTFIATAEAVVRAGARPRFVDVHADTGLVDLASCEDRLSGVTKAVIPVHLYGRMVEMGPVLDFAERHGLVVVEDAAQAHGARRDGRCAGTVGHAGCFSFYPGKNLGAFGDAGAVVTRDATLAERIRLLRDHGRLGKHAHHAVGFNSRLDALQAAVLSVKLPHLAEWNERRRAFAAEYRRTLPAAVLDGEVAPPEADVVHVFPILVERREALLAHLATAGVDAGIHYAEPVNRTRAFAAYGEPCPAAERRAARQLSLPMHPHLTPEAIERVAWAIESFDLAVTA
jgi:dTDP-4-amino-4,6-dideoxygalactose transaminase